MAGSFTGYDEYMRSVFDCVNRALDEHLEGMKQVFASGQGGFKNVLYPDLEVASDVTRDKILAFDRDVGSQEEESGGEASMFSSEDEEDDGGIEGLDDELASFG